MTRKTIDDAQTALEHLCRALGKTAAPYHDAHTYADTDPDRWALDYAPQYGGVCIVTDDESRPFGLYSRRPIKEFCSCVDFACWALEIQKQNQERERS